MPIETELITLCDELGKRITGLTHHGQPVNGGRLLLTIAGLESSFGAKRLFVRNEPAYSPGGRYYKDNEELRALYAKYGVLAASSFGTFQIMFPAARELGFTEHPIELQKDAVCGHWATQLIVKRFIQRYRAGTLKDVLDSYNSGSHKDSFIPSLYIEHGMRFYEDLQSV